MTAFNRYSESNQSEELINTIKKHLQTNDNEISNTVDEYKKCFNIKRDEFKFKFENGEKDYQKTNKKEIDKILVKKLGELEISKEFQKLIKMIC